MMKFAMRIKPGAVLIHIFLFSLMSSYAFQSCFAAEREVALKCTFPLWKYHRLEGSAQDQEAVYAAISQMKPQNFEQLLVIDIGKSKYYIGLTEYLIGNAHIRIKMLNNTGFDMFPDKGPSGGMYGFFKIIISRIDLTAIATFDVASGCRSMTDGSFKCNKPVFVEINGSCVRVPKLL